MLRIFYILIALFCAGQVSADQTVRLTTGEWSPLISHRYENDGILPLIVREAFALQGFDVIYQFQPWAVSYKEARDNKFDGSLGWAPNEQRSHDFYFSDPIYTSRKVFFHLKSLNFMYNSIDDLKGLRIGVTRTYKFGSEFDNAVKNGLLNINYVDNNPENISNLNKQVIDLFPMDLLVGNSLINRYLTVESGRLITYDPRIFAEIPISLIFSRKIPDQRARRLLSAFNIGLAELKASGRYNRMLQLQKVKAGQ
ncbi:substrate-binding periplasmic protein [Psychromonas aquimarina]|uniref:substrate-binding periplasmic protein n=1 Tax=Psychromonas aquimarina TaxID=444919 RepID=UPI0004127C6F|nr:transporter substrate-binding domain-containing protein [Psychromonas aquimarina]